jgi:hypothetical protein
MWEGHPAPLAAILAATAVTELAPAVTAHQAAQQ